MKWNQLLFICCQLVDAKKRAEDKGKRLEKKADKLAVKEKDWKSTDRRKEDLTQEVTVPGSEQAWWNTAWNKQRRRTGPIPHPELSSSEILAHLAYLCVQFHPSLKLKMNF